MHRVVARAAVMAFVLGDASRVVAGPLVVLVPCDELPAAVAALDLKSAIDSYGIAPDASVAVAATASPGEDERSDIWLARVGEEPRAVKLAGRVLGLAVASDGNRAYAVVRVTDRKGTVKRVELVSVDLKNARAISGATLPATARGLAIGADGATLLVASRDEIRTFQLPDLASGRMYRALGDNVGVAPVGSSSVLIAQPSRVVIADLAGTQGRDGLVLSQETAAPVTLTGLVSSTTDGGAIVLSDGAAWCVRIEGPPLPPPPPPEEPAEPPQTQPAPAEAPAEVPAPEIAPPSPVPPPPPVPEPVPEPAPQEVPAAPEIPAAAGTVSGSVSGPALAEVAAVVFLGPDSVLHEALRVVPDERGRFRASALPIGAYRIVAAGKGGRVLICDPSFITIRVGSDGAVEAPVLKVLRAQ